MNIYVCPLSTLISCTLMPFWDQPPRVSTRSHKFKGKSSTWLPFLQNQTHWRSPGFPHFQMPSYKFRGSHDPNLVIGYKWFLGLKKVLFWWLQLSQRIHTVPGLGGSGKQGFHTVSGWVRSCHPPSTSVCSPKEKCHCSSMFIIL